MGREELNKKIKENKWLILAILFFITWKFFLIHILWQGRVLPPEPDDAYNYISHIANIINCPNFQLCSSLEISMQNSTGYIYLSYRLFFGYLAKIFSFSPQTIYHISFYLGTIFLAVVLTPFLKIFTNNKNLIAWTIFFLGFYHGLGETHGFFWVVPSFFALLLFFSLAAYCLNQETRLNIGLILLLGPFYTFTHALSVFLILILPLYLVFLFCLGYTPKLLVWKKTLSVVAIVLLSSFTVTSLLQKSESQEYAYSLKEVLNQTQPTVTPFAKPLPLQEIKTPEILSPPFSLSKFLLEKIEPFGKNIEAINQVYFRWILPHWIFIVLYLLCFFVLLYKKKIELITFYIACLFFFLLSAFSNPHGYRSGIVIWPLTFIFFAFSSWYFIDIVREKLSGFFKRITLAITLFFIFSFLAINSILAFFFNENINVRNDYPIKLELIQYINSLPPEKTIAFSKEFVVAEMWNMPAIRIRSTHFTAKPDFVIITSFNQIQEKPRSSFSQTVRHLATKLGFSSASQIPQTPSILPPGYTLEKNFGTFELYKKLP